MVEEIQERRLSLLYLDAHPDLYESYQGSSYSHATVVSRILDRNNSGSRTVCYVGIRASTREHERIRDLGLVEYTARDVYTRGCSAIASSIRPALTDEPVYLSVDLDCLDPAFAPGVGNPQPAGLSTRQVFDILQGVEGLEIVAADIVEYSPRFDLERTTAFTSAILIKEIMGVMAETSSRNLSSGRR